MLLMIVVARNNGNNTMIIKHYTNSITVMIVKIPIPNMIITMIARMIASSIMITEYINLLGTYI